MKAFDLRQLIEKESTLLATELLGRRKFGVIAGLLAAPFIGVFALAPTIAGMMWTVGGYNVVIAMAGTASLVAVAALLLASRLAPVDTAQLNGN